MKYKLIAGPGIAISKMILLSCVIVTMAQADSKSERESLAGLKGVVVVIEQLQPEVEQRGLTKSAIQTEVELKLREVGIRVWDEQSAPVGCAVLYVRPSVLPSPEGWWPYDVDVTLAQDAVLLRNYKTRPLVVTWNSTGVIGGVGAAEIRNVRNAIKDQVDQFINAYLSVNPKKNIP